MIRFDKATVTYPGGVTALDNVDLEIDAGEFIVVVGLSGAGKSTLIRTVNGLVPLTGGSVHVGDREVSSLSKSQLRSLRADVGMIFQHYNLVNRTTVLNNVLMGQLHRLPSWRSMLGWWGRDATELAMQSLEIVDIVDKAYVRAANLSGGQQQRVGIARALAQQPTVLLADEPVASLDPPTSHSVMRYLQKINRELGITTLVNLHFLDLAREYADRIVGLRRGKIIFDGPAESADEKVFEQIYGRSLTAADVLEGEAAL